MKHFFKMAVLFSVSFFLSRNTWADSDLELLRGKVTAELLASDIDIASVQGFVQSLNAEGAWPTINYKDLSSTGFQNSEHLKRLVDMCRAYRKPTSLLKNNEKLNNAIGLALDYWLQNDFICDNWWWNQIGVPDMMVSILLIMDQDLTPKQIEKALQISARANMNASGARPSGDRIKIAGILAKRLLFERDSVEFGKIIKVIEGEIKFTTGEGLQYDYSFHHRKDRVNNTLSYGTGYADAAAYWAALVAPTHYRFSIKATHILVDYYLDGICKMLIYGKYPDPGAKNREITREGALQPYNSVTPQELLNATSYRENELREIIKIRDDDTKPRLSFSKSYWQSEHYTFQRPAFFTSVRMYSTRCDNMEQPYNGEGLMNHYRGDGANYISRTGTEYDSLSPVYDWQKIPGTTVVQRSQMPPPKEIQKRGLTNFVGAVTDGTYGAAGFDFKSPLDPMKARKSWFFFDKEYVCLGAGITEDSNLTVATTINQCRLVGNVLVKQKKSSSILSKGLHQLHDVEWIWHDSIGYIFQTSQDIHLSNVSQTGSWYKVNRQRTSPQQEVTDDIFKLWIDHGPHPEEATYQYTVLPAATKEEMDAAYKNSPIVIISNTPGIQAVKNTHLGICEAVFYEPGKINISKGIDLEMKTPGIVIVKYANGAVSSISVEDPSRNLVNIRMALSIALNKKGQGFSSEWDKENQMSEIIIGLPKEVYSGESVTIHF